MATSKTSLTMSRLKKDGWLVSKVEKFNHITKRYNDLWGFIDVLAIKGDEILAIQDTSYSHISDRIKKITAHENLSTVRDAGIRIEVWGWRKVKNRWQVKIVDLS